MILKRKLVFTEPVLRVMVGVKRGIGWRKAESKGVLG